MEELEGVMCRGMMYDYTPLGLSRLAFIVARTDEKGVLGYIPCRAYGTNADALNRLTECDKVLLKGHYSFANRIADGIPVFMVVGID